MRRSATAVALGAVLILATLSLTACGPDDVPTAPETVGATAKPRATAEPDAAEPVGEMPGATELLDDTEQPTAEPAGDLPELWSVVDPALDIDGASDCSPYSLERDYLDGTLTPDDFTRYAVFGPWDPESIPEQYRPCPDADMLTTGGMLWAMQFLEYVSPAVQQEVTTFFTPTKVPPEG